MEPDFDFKPFPDMSAKEARNYFDWYVDEIPKRLDLLSRAFEATGGGQRDLLDLSPGSLIDLWGWFLPQIVVERKAPGVLREEVDAAPDWLRGFIITNDWNLSLGTTALAMDIAIYFGEVFNRKFDHIQWGVVTKPRSLAYVNRPVLVGFKTRALDPRRVVYNLTLKASQGQSKRSALYELYEVWAEDI